MSLARGGVGVCISFWQNEIVVKIYRRIPFLVIYNTQSDPYAVFFPPQNWAEGVKDILTQHFSEFCRNIIFWLLLPPSPGPEQVC